MKVLVTGKSGQLACSLAELGANAHSVLALGRPEFDIRDAGSVLRTIVAAAPDVVVNAGAYTAVDKAETEVEEAFAINATGAGNVARACHAAGIPIIHISTDYVFDGTKHAPYVETDATGPIGAYGRSKLAGEANVATACPRHVILRTSWVHAPFGYNFVRTMLRLAETRPDLNVVDDQHGNPTYAPHLADAVMSIAAAICGPDGRSDAWGIYHAAGSGDTTWCDFAREVFRCSAALGGPSAVVHGIPTSQYPTPARRPANSRMDCGALARTFAIRFPDWKEGVGQCVGRLVGKH